MSVEIMPIIASAMQHSYDGDPIVAPGVENQMVADWKKAQAAGEVVGACCGEIPLVLKFSKLGAARIRQF